MQDSGLRVINKQRAVDLTATRAWEMQNLGWGFIDKQSDVEVYLKITQLQ